MGSAKPVVMVVEDDPGIRRGLVDSLRYGGYDVVECAEGTSARERLTLVELDLVLLDVVLPGADGFELLAELRRARPSLPVILVTARGAEEDRVRGLRTGADDYVVKPFSSSELLARVEAVLRRSPERPNGARSIALDGLAVDLERREVRDGSGGVRELTLREVEVLRYLAGAHGRAISRDELLRHVWHVDPRNLETRTVDMAIARLREKLGEPAHAPRLLVTVRALGYKLGDGVEVRA